MKRNVKKVILSAALAILTAPYALALDLPALYKEASAPWSAEQAVRLPAVLTPETLTEIGKNYGAAARGELAAKKKKVSALVGRFRTCDLNGEDLKTAERYLNKEFKKDVSYFTSYGCKAVKESPDTAGSAPSASLGRLEELSASHGAGKNYSRFFDGSVNSGSVPEAVMTGAGGAEVPLEPRAPVKKTQAASEVPLLNSRSGISKPVPAPMPDINETGRVHKAVNYLNAMCKRNWEAVKSGDLKGAQKAKAAIKAAAAYGFAAWLGISNLPKTEKAAARLRWDLSQDAQSEAITADAAKLVFHAGVSTLAIIPLPIVSVVKAAMNGATWAIALIGAMTAGPLNNTFHFAD